MENLIYSLESAPVIIAGDFNARENYSHMRRLSRQWIDAYRVVNRNDPGYSCCLREDVLNEEANKHFFARLDCVFLMDGNGFSWKANNARRILSSPLENNGELQWASNHAGVFAEASLEFH